LRLEATERLFERRAHELDPLQAVRSDACGRPQANARCSSTRQPMAAWVVFLEAFWRLALSR